MSDKNKFAFQKMNYFIMIGGVVLLMIGFIIMSSDTEPYGFGFFGITLGPIIVMLGFVVEFVAIFYKPSNKKEKSETP